MRIKSDYLKILLFSQKPEEYWVRSTTLDWLYNSDSHKCRLQLARLEKKEEVFVQRNESEWLVSLSKQGRDSLIAQFPALNSDVGDWYLIIFVSNNSSDQSFKLVRTQLLKYRSVKITRGVYFLPSKPSQDLLSTISQLYSKEVLVVPISETSQEEFKPLLFKKYKLSDIYSTYSGISSELSHLIAKVRKHKRLNNSVNLSFISAFHRYYENLSEDPGQIFNNASKSELVSGLLRQFQMYGSHLL